MQQLKSNNDITEQNTENIDGNVNVQNNSESDNDDDYESDVSN